MIGVARGNGTDDLQRAGAHLLVHDASELILSEDTRLVVKTLSGLPSAWDREEDIRRRVSGKPLAVFLDYDGTLTPIVEDHTRARLSGDMRVAMDSKSSVPKVPAEAWNEMPNFCRNSIRWSRNCESGWPASRAMRSNGRGFPSPCTIGRLRTTTSGNLSQSLTGCSPTIKTCAGDTARRCSNSNRISTGIRVTPCSGFWNGLVWIGLRSYRSTSGQEGARLRSRRQAGRHDAGGHSYRHRNAHQHPAFRPRASRRRWAGEGATTLSAAVA